MTVRSAAARVVSLVDEGRLTLAAALERERGGIADDRDRGLLVELATGTLRWRGQLDAVISQASNRPIAGTDPMVLAILRVAAYQLLHLDRVPDHAIVDEAVESTRALSRRHASGFVNAVLRALQRDDEHGALPPRPAETADRADQIAYLATSLSHPAWLVHRWIDRYGFTAAEEWCRFNNAAPTLTVRATPPADTARLLRALETAGVGATRATAVPDAITLAPGAFGRLPRDLRAQVTVQDEGSQLIAHTVRAERGLRCLDLCAAPGGKSTILWHDMRGSGLLVASDRRPSRLRLLGRELRHAGTPAAIVGLDATQPLPFPAVFDRVLVDAPCSGLGTLRRDPDIKWRRQVTDLPRFAGTQQTMLRHAAEAVRPGGWLVYSTCSSEPEENEEVVRAFLASDSRYAFRSQRDDPAAAETPFVDPSGCLRTLPFRDHLDAFFAAVLVRLEGT